MFQVPSRCGSRRRSSSSSVALPRQGAMVLSGFHGMYGAVPLLRQRPRPITGIYDGDYQH